MGAWKEAKFIQQSTFYYFCYNFYFLVHCTFQVH
jgi:hypothetical protein